MRTSSDVSSHQLSVAGPKEALGRRRAVDLRVLEQVTIKAWDRLLFVECGDGWLVEEAWRRLGKGCVCGLSTSRPLVDLTRGAAGRRSTAQPHLTPRVPDREAEPAGYGDKD